MLPLQLTTDTSILSSRHLVGAWHKIPGAQNESAVFLTRGGIPLFNYAVDPAPNLQLTASCAHSKLSGRFGSGSPEQILASRPREVACQLENDSDLVADAAFAAVALFKTRVLVRSDLVPMHLHSAWLAQSGSASALHCYRQTQR